MTLIQIKNRINGRVLFEYEKENNTLKGTLVEAVKNRVDLDFAHLFGADLSGADLSGAVLFGAVLFGADLSGANLFSADLREAVLFDANLFGADLRNADLRNAYLCNANLSGANLSGANLSGANLSGAYLYGTNLSGATLNFANLSYADLVGADLSDASLYRADLNGADLRFAKNVPPIPLACPSKGTFIGWKKVHTCLVKLEIPEDAKRTSATTNKCRCDKAKVLAITDLNGENPIGEIENTNYELLTYKVGEMVYPDSFDEDRWNECSHGIHFFINKEDAINY